MFYNSLPYSIDFYWVDSAGRKNGYVKKLEPRVRHQEYTFLTHPWVFRAYIGGERLFSYSNGYSGSVFEGKEFGVANHDSINVIISHKSKRTYVIYYIQTNLIVI